MKYKNKIIALAIFVVLVFGAGSVLVLVSLKNKDENGGAADFSSCSVLKENCPDKSCDLFYLCNEAEVKSCKVFDCGEKYGIETADADGVISKKYRDKFNKEKSELDIKECGGRLAVTEKKECKNDSGELTVQILTGENCEITGFTLKIDGQDKMVPFRKENDTYKLNLNKCGEITDITAIGEGGVQIKESY